MVCAVCKYSWKFVTVLRVWDQSATIVGLHRPFLVATDSDRVDIVNSSVDSVVPMFANMCTQLHIPFVTNCKEKSNLVSTVTRTQETVGADIQLSSFEIAYNTFVQNQSRISTGTRTQETVGADIQLSSFEIAYNTFVQNQIRFHNET